MQFKCYYTDDSNDDLLNIVADNNFITYFLDKINYKIFKCNKLLYDFDNLKSNFAFYIILSSLFVKNFLMLFFIHVRFQDTSIGLITKNNNYGNFTSNNAE